MFGLRLRRFPFHVTRSMVSYVQGKSPNPKTREYFYYIDHQGQLFLDDTKVKNFITCFKDKKFLAFFFKRLKDNETTQYQTEFPYISPCGPETNYIRCDDVPIVFTHLLNTNKHIIQDIQDYATSTTIEETCLSFGGAGELLTIPFQPEKLHMFPESGRVYHVGPEKSGSVGLIKSSLAIELSRYFVYNFDRSHDKGEESCDNIPPTGFTWRGRTYELDNTIEKYLRQKQKRNVEISAN